MRWFRNEVTERGGEEQFLWLLLLQDWLAGWLMILLLLLLLGCCLAAGPGAEGLVVIEHRKIGSFSVGFDLVSELN